MTRHSTALALALALAPGFARAQPARTVANPNYGFTVTVPSSWSVQRTVMADPFPNIEDFKAGRVSLSGTIDTGGEEPAEWNALQLNGMQAVIEDGRLALPQITLYAHPHQARTFDEFTKDLNEWLTMFRSKTESATKKKTKAGVDIYDYVYRMGPASVRVAMLYGNGVRYGVMYMARDSVSYVKDGPAFDAFVSSIELTKPAAPAAVVKKNE